jgi:hypothetical protein
MGEFGPFVQALVLAVFDTGDGIVHGRKAYRLSRLRV